MSQTYPLIGPLQYGHPRIHKFSANVSLGQFGALAFKPIEYSTTVSGEQLMDRGGQKPLTCSKQGHCNGTELQSANKSLAKVIEKEDIRL